MAATEYTDQQQYIKFLKNKTCAEHGHPEGCDCHKEGDENCGCCPPGLIAIYDDSQHQIACLTPNDAELYKKNILTCNDGYVKLIVVSTGEFLGCVSEDEFATLYPIVNPAG